MKSKQWDAIKTTVRTNIVLPKGKQLLTEKQWLKRGYVPISENAGEKLWSNQFCSGWFRYLFEDEVKKKEGTECKKALVKWLGESKENEHDGE